MGAAKCTRFDCLFRIYRLSTVAASLEAVVYMELCQRGYTVHIGKSGDGEIDFVSTRQNEKIHVKVTQRVASEKTERREYDYLMEIRDNYPKNTNNNGWG